MVLLCVISFVYVLHNEYVFFFRLIKSHIDVHHMNKEKYYYDPIVNEDTFFCDTLLHNHNSTLYGK